MVTSLLAATDGVPDWARAGFDLGRRFAKEAADAEVAYNLSGMLYLSATGYLLLSVPNSFVIGVYKAMDEPGVELPPGPDGRLNAHVTVMRPEEVTACGGGDKIKERGKHFRYTLGRLYAAEPDGWKQVAKVWFVRVHSPELQELRRSYGLPSLPNDGKHDFHCTVAVRRKGVLGRNETAKGDQAPAG